jgi:hypothetical protein
MNLAAPGPAHGQKGQVGGGFFRLLIYFFPAGGQGQFPGGGDNEGYSYGHGLASGCFLCYTGYYNL